MRFPTLATVDPQLAAGLELLGSQTHRGPERERAGDAGKQAARRIIETLKKLDHDAR